MASLSLSENEKAIFEEISRYNLPLVLVSISIKKMHWLKLVVASYTVMYLEKLEIKLELKGLGR